MKVKLLDERRYHQNELEYVEKLPNGTTVLADAFGNYIYVTDSEFETINEEGIITELNES